MPRYRYRTVITTYDVFTRRCHKCQTEVDKEYRSQGGRMTTSFGSPLVHCPKCGNEEFLPYRREWNGKPKRYLSAALLRGLLIGGALALLPMLIYAWSRSQGGNGLIEGAERFVLAVGLVLLVLPVGVCLRPAFADYQRMRQSLRRLAAPGYREKLARHGIPVDQPVMTEAQALWSIDGNYGDLIYSPVGDRLFAWGWNLAPVLVDAGKGQILHTFAAPASPIKCAAFSWDSQRLCTGHEDGTALVWDVATGSELFRVSGQKSIGCVAFSPNGLSLWTLGELPMSLGVPNLMVANKDTTIQLLDTRNGAVVYQQDTQVANRFVAYAPDGRYVMIQGNAAHVWDGAGKPLGTIAPPSLAKNPPEKAHWVLGGAMLILESFRALFLFDGYTLKAMAEFDKDGQSLFSTANFLMGFRRENRVELHEFPVRWLAGVQLNGFWAGNAAFSPDGTRLAVLGSGKLSVFDLAPVVAMLGKGQETQPAAANG